LQFDKFGNTSELNLNSIPVSKQRLSDKGTFVSNESFEFDMTGLDGSHERHERHDRHQQSHSSSKHNQNINNND